MTTFTTGNASISTDQDLQSFYVGFLDKVAPNARRVIDEKLAEIESRAQKDWPKRKKRSRGSARKFERGYKVDASGSIVGFLKNTAPYAWAIKFGMDSENSQGQDLIYARGKRVGNELLLKPLRKSSRHVVNALADDIAKRIGDG